MNQAILRGSGHCGLQCDRRHALRVTHVRCVDYPILGNPDYVGHARVVAIVLKLTPHSIALKSYMDLTIGMVRSP
jgi:hypothetical protein